jgi:CxxC motif-containing protein (DUF1111 family)
MKAPYRAWYIGIALLALAPAGARLLSWSGNRDMTVDPAVAEAGRTLFLHEWTPNDPLCANGDGLGPVYNANSCVACHSKGGIGGSGDREFNVTTFSVVPPFREAAPREGVVHKASTHAPELLNQVDPSFPPVPPPPLAELDQLTPRRAVGMAGCGPRPAEPVPLTGTHFSQRNTPPLFGVKLIEEIPDRVIIAGEKAQKLRWVMHPAGGLDKPIGRASRLPDGRIGRFGWKAQTATLSDFVQAACANELGLGNPGQAAARPLYEPGYEPPGMDLTIEQCNQLTAFVASLPRPVERVPDDVTDQRVAMAGKKLFRSTGCAECHTPDLGGVEGLYSDLLLHRMGSALSGGGGGYGDPRPSPSPTVPGSGPQLDEWRTPPLWGVAASAPYLHDGRANTLSDAIFAHDGQAKASRERFAALTESERRCIVVFLETLRAP